MRHNSSAAPAGVIRGGARLRIGLGAAVVLVLLAAATAVLVIAVGGEGVTRTVGRDGTVSSDAGAVDPGAVPTESLDPGTTGAPASVILVHLLGAVARPGLYELRDGDRAVDAVAAAGGFAEGADQGGLNLARRLTDGEQLYVPLVGETPPPGQAARSPAGSTVASGLIDLNTADAAALDLLPGVGPATAARILAWRETNGRFTAVEDLLSVSGIGEKTFAELKDLVTV